MAEEEHLGGPHIINYFDCEIVKNVGSMLVLMGAERDLVGLGLRILAFQAKNGKFPNSLDELGGSQPTDPFSGKPFAYEATSGGFKITCSGPDAVQESARTFEYPAVSN